MTSLFDLLMLGMGLYVLFAGITGKGRLYAADNVKKGLEQKFKKTLRIIFLCLGAFMTLNGVASLLLGMLYTSKVVQEATETTAAVYEVVPTMELGGWSFLTPELLQTLMTVFLITTIALVIVLFIIIRKFIDRNAPRQRQNADPRQAGHVLPVSAFEFDDAPEQSEDDGSEQ